jgi:glycosyltransferase involved in cell wall biosynthesis
MVKENNPRFTVIIPTKDRADYLHHTLRTCSLQDYENLEIIVSDDGSTDHTREIVEEAARKDSRIRYVSPGVGVGMRENFEFVLSQVKSGYIIALGGDDGLLPYGIRGMLDVLNDTGQEMLAWPAPVFSYPSARTRTGQLALYRQRGQRIIQSKSFLRRQVKNLYYLSDIESPMFYVKGVVSIPLIEKVKSRSPQRRFYNCPTPDGYSGIVLAGEVTSYAFSGEPFSIYGLSPASQGLAYLASGDQAQMRSEAFFRNASEMPMHRELASQPYSPLVTLMTADYILSIQDLPGWPGSFPPIDFKDLLVKSLRELAHGLYAEERLSREIHILKNIAEFHGLGDFFRNRINSSRRYMKKDPFEGNAVSPKMLFLDCNLFSAYNIYDASYFAYYIHKVSQELSFSVIFHMLTNSINYKIRSLRKGTAFPP